MDKIYIIMPAYNESENIKNIVHEWHPIIQKIGNDSKLIIIDDGSKDNSKSIYENIKNQYKSVEIIEKPNSGHGPTCIFGYDYAIQNNADYIFQTDSDGQTVADEFWKFWENRNDYSYIIGYRNKREDGFSRVIVTKILKIVIFLVKGVVVKDANTPFRLMNVSTLKKYINLIPKNFFLANVLLSIIYVKYKEEILWIPITFKERSKGENSINIPKIIKIGLKAIKDLKDIKI